nr:reverse transcriptase domain-containing protein [Tanacetum cinerariifolium]
MEPRHVRVRETTPVIRIRSLRARRQRERVVEFEDTPNRDGSRVERNPEGRRPSEHGLDDNRIHGTNLPPLLAARLGRSENDDTLKILGLHEEQHILGFVHGLHEEQRISGFVHGLRTRSLVEFLSTYLPTTYKVKVAKTFEQPPCMLGSRWSSDMTKYYHFYENHRHNTNDCCKLRHRIKEVVKSGQLYHLVKGIKKARKDHISKRKSEEEPVSRLGEITFPPISCVKNSSDPEMGIVVSPIHRAIKFHTLRDVGTVLSTYKPGKVGERSKRLREVSLEVKKGVLSCTDAKEKITINDKYPEQSIIIGIQLPTNFKEKLRDLLRRNLDAYVDDMVIKSIFEEDMMKDFQETFDRFCSINMKLNLKKCSFGVEKDSQLMVNQIKGFFEARQLTIKQYLEKVKEILKGFDIYMIEHVRHNHSKKADVLSKLASMTFEHLTKEVLVEVLGKRSINSKEVSKIEAEKGENWMNLIYEYLLSSLLPEDPKYVRKIKIRAP